MKSYKAYLLGAAASVVFLMSGEAVQAQSEQSGLYYTSDGSRTDDYEAALSSWKEDRNFSIDYSKAFLGLEHAYARGLSGQGLTIGVNDAGIHVNHPIFGDGSKITGYDSGVPDYYGNNGQVNPRRPWESHGTHVAGTIAAIRSDNTAMFGNAYNANILSATANFVSGDFRWYGDYASGMSPNTGYDNVLGLAQTGQVRIINNSWGSANSVAYNAPRTTVEAQLTGDWEDFWDPIKEHDVLVIWSAGNGSTAHAGSTTTVPMTDPSLRAHWLSVANYQAAGNPSPSSSLCGQTATWCVAGPGHQIVSGVNIASLNTSAISAQYRNTEGYGALWSAGTVTALNTAAQNIFVGKLNAFLNARNSASAQGVEFDSVEWANSIAQTAAEVALIYGARTNSPDANVSTLSSLIYSNYVRLGAEFADAFYIEADARLQDLHSTYLTITGPGTAALTGTSMAAPNISGFAGLLMEYFPEYNTSLISDILVSSSRDLDTPGVDLRSGWGAPQMGTALEGPTALRDIRDVNVLVGTRDVWTNAITDARDRYDADVLLYNGNDIGGLTKIGGGELVLAGNILYSGDTRVLGGLLTVNSDIARSHLTVAENGIVGGTGSLASLVAERGGVVLAGSSDYLYGSLIVKGDAVFEEGSYLWVNSDVNGTRYSQLHVQGNTELKGGTVVVKANSGNWNLRTNGMRILTSSGQTGEFDGVTSDLGFLRSKLSYDGHAVLLTLERNDVSFGDVLGKANERALGLALDQMVLAHSTGNLALEDALMDGSINAVAAVLPSLTGEAHASLAAVSTADTRFIRNAILERGRGGASLVQQMDGKGLQAWASVVAGEVEFDGNANYAGYLTDTNGFVTGIDKVGANGHIGVAIGQTRSKLKKFELAQDADVSTRNLAVYGGWNRGALSLRAGAAVSQSDVDARRTASINAFSDRMLSDYEGDGWQAYGEVAWSTQFKGNQLTPYASLTHIQYDADFVERGGDAALSGNVSETADLLALGVRSHTVLRVAEAGRPGVTLVGHLAWSENLNSDGVDMTAAFADGPDFDVSSASLAGDALLVDVSMNFDISPRTTMGIGYSGAHGSDYSDRRIVGRLSYKF